MGGSCQVTVARRPGPAPLLCSRLAELKLRCAGQEKQEEEVEEKEGGGWPWTSVACLVPISLTLHRKSSLWRE